MVIECPVLFDYDECLVYMQRSPLETTHKFLDKTYRKVLKINDELLLIEVIHLKDKLEVNCLNKEVSEIEEKEIIKCIRFIFDLDFDLNSLYDSKVDEKIDRLFIDFKGLRLIHMDNLYEGLIWAVLGQQINLKFAYTLKKRLVETYGDYIEFENEKYYYFPDPKIIASLDIETLRDFQITRRKSEYILGISKLFNEKYFEVDYDNLYDQLLLVRGIGEWTANYVMMKCYPLYDSVLHSDAGVINALKELYELEEKPTKAWIMSLFEPWHYKGYIIFYLWRLLYV